MTDTCQYRHHALSRLPRRKREDLVMVPDNGIYLLFENDEPDMTASASFVSERIAGRTTCRAAFANISTSLIRTAAYSASTSGAARLPKWAIRSLHSGRSTQR